ncbi:MAG TPA: DUF4345 family protein [Candidatus Binatia bacterium]|nr:DUF4345 family protein [Candidatus Binatia bacterium]
MSPAVILVVAGSLLAMGVAALLAPARILATFGVAVTTVDGRNEVRAVYGGYGVAMAGMLMLALVTPELAPGIFTCLAGALAGMAGGRLVSAAIDRRAGLWPWVFFVLEALGAIVLVVAAA